MRSGFVRALSSALALGLGSAALAAQQPLTLRQAIDRALGRNPEAAAAHAGEQDAAAAARLARTPLLPRLNFTEDISRGNDPVYVFGTRLRQGLFTQADFGIDSLNHPTPIGDFVTRFNGSWLAFDSFKTEKQIHGADLAKKSSVSSAKAVNQEIVLNVVKAYEQVLYAEREVEVARHEEQTAEALLTSVDQHVKAGLAVESDLMSAQVNLAARKEDRIAAQGGLEVAWAQLRMAMGVEHLQPSQLAPIEPHVFPQTPLEQELAQAAKARPDLTALHQAQQAQAEAVGAARSDFGPRISAYGNWEEDRPTFAGPGGNNWVAGVQLNLDILPVGKREQLARAKAAKQQIDAQRTLAEQQVRLEVSQAHIALQTAALSVDTARAATAQAAEGLRIVRNRYNAGLATITDLLRAEDAERQSQANYWRAVYGNATAYAELLYATGTLTPDAAEGLQ